MRGFVLLQWFGVLRNFDSICCNILSGLKKIALGGLFPQGRDGAFFSSISGLARD